MDDDMPCGDHAAKVKRSRKKHLYTSILQLMEFYFSDANLSKDRFLKKVIDENPNVPLATFLKFNKIRDLTHDVDDIIKAVKKSDLLVISEDKKYIYRNKPLASKKNVDECTIYVENIPSDTTHDFITQKFSEFGKVDYVSLPKYKTNGLLKGFAFIEFDTEESAQKALLFFESIGSKMSAETEPEKLLTVSTFSNSGSDDHSKSDNHKAICTPNEKLAPTEVNVLTARIRKKDYKLEEIENAQFVLPTASIETNNDLEQLRNLEVRLSIQAPIKGEASGHTCDMKDKCIPGNEKEDVICTSEIVCQNEIIPSVKRKLSIEQDQENDQLKKCKQEIVLTPIESDKIKRKDKKKRQLYKELGYQVLSKKVWKKLRNKYLELQRQKFSEFKMNYTKMNTKSDTNKDEAQNRLVFAPGLIIRIKLNSNHKGCDSKVLKNKIKTAYPTVKHVDTTSLLSTDEVYLRMANNEDTQLVKAESMFGSGTILVDEEEQEYWGKIFIDQVRKGQERPKIRGRDKILKRASNMKHIIFDE